MIAGPGCIECNTPLRTRSSPLCPRCRRELPWWRAIDGCPRCGTRLPAARGAIRETGAGRSFEGCPGCLSDGSGLHACRSLLRYEGAVRRWVPGFKSARSPFGPGVSIRLAIDHLADELAGRVQIETAERPDLIVPVPLHPQRRRRRGFNQSAPIAYRIARILGADFAPEVLERSRAAPNQAGLSGHERTRNVQGSFRATVEFGPGARVWLVDDVLTTGNTLDAAADALLEAGAFEVRGLTLAATLPTRRASRRRRGHFGDGPSQNREEIGAGARVTTERGLGYANHDSTRGDR